MCGVHLQPPGVQVFLSAYIGLEVRTKALLQGSSMSNIQLHLQSAHNESPYPLFLSKDYECWYFRGPGSDMDPLGALFTSAAPNCSGFSRDLWARL